MTNPQYDVAIIGLGPVGATAAILFAEAGLNVVVIERDMEVYKLPRAVNLDGEIIRAFQSIGRADEIDALLQTVRPGDRGGFANSKREWMFGTNFKDFGSNGWQPNNMFDQPELESYLRKNAEEHPNVTAFIGMEACSFQDGTTAVDILVKNTQQLKKTILESAPAISLPVTVLPHPPARRSVLSGMTWATIMSGSSWMSLRFLDIHLLTIQFRFATLTEFPPMSRPRTHIDAGSSSCYLMNKRRNA